MIIHYSQDGSETHYISSSNFFL